MIKPYTLKELEELEKSLAIFRMKDVPPHLELIPRLFATIQQLQADKERLYMALLRAKNTVEQNFPGCRLEQETYDLLDKIDAARGVQLASSAEVSREDYLRGKFDDQYEVPEVEPMSDTPYTPEELESLRTAFHNAAMVSSGKIALMRAEDIYPLAYAVPRLLATIDKLSASKAKVCSVCFTASWEPTPDGERCGYCWLTENLSRLLRRIAEAKDWLNGSGDLTQRVAHARKMLDDAQEPKIYELPKS